MGISISAKGERGGTAPPPPAVLFTTTWTTTVPGQLIILPYSALGTYSGTIDWGDATTSVNSYANRNHYYASPGTYTVEINGTCNGWNFNNFGGANASYITSVVNWGQLQLGSSTGYYFNNCSNLDLSSVSDVLDLTGIFNLESMFSNSGISTVNNINSWNTSSVINMGGMFSGASSFDQELTFDTSSVTDMNSMFGNTMLFNQPVNAFDTSSVIDMSYMFYNATSFNQSLSNFDTSNVNNMGGMFSGASSFDQSLSNFNTSSVIDMSYMFNGAQLFDQSLSTFDTSNVTDMSYMFYDATSFNQNIGAWNVGNVIYFFDFMGNKTPATFSTANLNAIYNGWSASGVQPNNFISFGTAKYTLAADEGRAILTGVNNWNITDGGIE
jgi:surface protein